MCAAVLFENTKFFMLTSFLSDLMTAFATTTTPLLAAVYREVLDYRANNSEQLYFLCLTDLYNTLDISYEYQDISNLAMALFFKYRICVNATPGFYFSKWVFG